MEKNKVKFQESDLLQKLHIDSIVSSEITQFETYLFKNDIVDESNQVILQSANYLKYFKNNTHVLSIFPKEESWDIEIIAQHFNIHPFVSSTLNMILNIEKMSWRLCNVGKSPDIYTLFNSATVTYEPLSLAPYIQSLTTVLVTLYNNHNDSIETVVLPLFWEGAFEEIEELMQKDSSSNFIYVDVFQLIQQWEKQICNDFISTLTDTSNVIINTSMIESFNDIKLLLNVVLAYLSNLVKEEKKKIGTTLFDEKYIFDDNTFSNVAEKYKHNFKQCSLLTSDLREAITVLNNKKPLPSPKQEESISTNHNEKESISPTFNEEEKKSSSSLYTHLNSFIQDDELKAMFIKEVIRGTNRNGLFLTSVVKSRFRFSLRKQKKFGNDLSEKYLSELVDNKNISLKEIGSKQYGAFNKEAWNSQQEDKIEEIIKGKFGVKQK